MRLFVAQGVYRVGAGGFDGLVADGDEGNGDIVFDHKFSGKGTPRSPKGDERRVKKPITHVIGFLVRMCR